MMITFIFSFLSDVCLTGILKQYTQIKGKELHECDFIQYNMACHIIYHQSDDKKKFLKVIFGD